VKPAGHNTWRDDQPITVGEGSGTSTQHIMVIEVSVIVLHQNGQFRGLADGAVVKGTVLQRQLCHQRLWVCAQALS
jgi:hypothetical protein